MQTVSSNDGTTIAYTKTGAGPVLILVDGAMCSREFGTMPKLVPLLSKHFTVIHYDRRDRGQSTNGKTYSPDREVEDIEALINACGGSAYLFGMSSGATLALKALTDGLLITKLALYEPPFEVEEKNDSTVHYHKVKDLVAADNRSGAAKYFLGTIVGMPSFAVTIMSWLPMWKKMKAHVSSLPNDLEITANYTLQNVELKSDSTPLLVMYGGKSPENLQNAAKAVSGRTRHSVMRMLEGQNHNVSMKVLAPVLIDFFKEQP